MDMLLNLDLEILQGATKRGKKRLTSSNSPVVIIVLAETTPFPVVDVDQLQAQPVPWSTMVNHGQPWSTTNQHLPPPGL